MLHSWRDSYYLFVPTFYIFFGMKLIDCFFYKSLTLLMSSKIRERSDR